MSEGCRCRRNRLRYLIFIKIVISLFSERDFLECADHSDTQQTRPDKVNSVRKGTTKTEKARTSSISVGTLSDDPLNCLSIALREFFFALGLCALNFTSGFCPSTPRVASTGSGRFHKFALNLARRSSRATACLNVRIIVLDVVKGSRRGISPTEFTVSLFDK